MLVLLGGSLVSMIQVLTGSRLNRFITKHLFTVERKKLPQTRDKSIEEELNSRPPARFKLFHCLSSRKQERRVKLFEKASDQIDSQLDIINFIKQQMSRIVERRLLFNQVERFLIMKQRDPFVLTSRRDDSHSTDQDIKPSQIDEYVERNGRSQYSDILLRGVFSTGLDSSANQCQVPPMV